jgi:hypothetical protein
MQTGGTSAVASPFCRLASRKRAKGENTDDDSGDLFPSIGATLPLFLSEIRCILTTRRNARQAFPTMTGSPAARHSGRPSSMVGDLGRTELATSAEDGARALFDSVQKLKSLPDYLEVLPGAYSGSVCGRSLSGKPTSTIGFEKRHNKAFRIEDVNAFLRAMLTDIPSPPPQAAQIRAINSGIVAAAK